MPQFDAVDEVKRILWYLKKFPVLAGLTPEAASKLAEGAELCEYKRRSVVYLPGDPGESLFLVHGGRIKISKVTRDGKALTLSYCGPSDLFGEFALVDGSPRQEMAEAVENSVVTKIHFETFNAILSQHARVGAAMVKELASRRHTLENKLEMLVFRDVTSKLAELLLQLGNDYGIEDARGILIALKITHQELANLIGSTRETVSLTLSQFKKKNLICNDGRKIIIANSEQLGALC